MFLLQFSDDNVVILTALPQISDSSNPNLCRRQGEPEVVPCSQLRVRN